MDKSALSVPCEPFAVFFHHNPLIERFLNIKSIQIHRVLTSTQSSGSLTMRSCCLSKSDHFAEEPSTRVRTQVTLIR